jgi:ribose transport system substrate-binding protein
MKKTVIVVLVLVLLSAFCLVGCLPQNAAETAAENSSSATEAAASSAQPEVSASEVPAESDLLADYAKIGSEPAYVEPEDFNVGQTAAGMKIGIAAGTVGSGFFKVIADTVQETLEANGVEVLLADANGSFEAQTKQIENFITQGVNGLVVNACDPPSAISEVLQKAADQGIPVVAVDSALDENFSNYLCVVGSDNYSLGFGVGEYIANQLKAEKGSVTGKAAVLDGVEGNAVAKARYDGFWDGVKSVDPENTLEEVSHLYGGAWTEEAGIQMAGDLFVAHPDVDVIFGISDPFCVAAAAEAQRAGIDGVMLCAVDGAKSAMKIIADGGAMKAIGLNDPVRMGKAAANALLSYINNGELPASRRSMLNPITATPENINELYNPNSPF